MLILKNGEQSLLACHGCGPVLCLLPSTLLLIVFEAGISISSSQEPRMKLNSHLYYSSSLVQLASSGLFLVQHAFLAVLQSPLRPTSAPKVDEPATVATKTTPPIHQILNETYSITGDNKLYKLIFLSFDIINVSTVLSIKSL